MKWDPTPIYRPEADNVPFSQKIPTPQGRQKRKLCDEPVPGEAHDRVHCANRRSPVKRMRSARDKELAVLMMQIAMISDEDGDRPIHVAVVHEDLKLVQKLCSFMLKASIPVDLTNFMRQTPLHLAVTTGNVRIVKILLKHGASLLLRDRNGNSVIHMAVKANADTDVLDVLLSHPQSNSILNSMDHEGYSALHHAVFRNNTVAVKCLHRKGMEINTSDGKSGRTALAHAVLEQNLEMVKLLLKCGACAMKADYSGRSVFELALQSSNAQIVKTLEKNVPLSDYISIRLSRSSYAPPLRPASNKHFRTPSEIKDNRVNTKRFHKTSDVL